MRPAVLALASLSVALAPASLLAHTRLMDPAPLTQDDNLKSGPCGCYFGAAPEDPTEDATPMKCMAGYPVTTFERGSTITVEWQETVNHDGDFRLAFTSKAPNQALKADLDANVIYEEPDQNAMSGGTVTAMITLPDVTCTECVLQLRQFMMGAAKPYYYSCAAIKLVDPGGTGGSGGSGGGAGGSPGTGGGDGGAPTSTGSGSNVDPSTGAGPAQPPITQKTGCNVGAEGGAAAGIALALALVAGRRPTGRKKRK